MNQESDLQIFFKELIELADKQNKILSADIVGSQLILAATMIMMKRAPNEIEAVKEILKSVYHSIEVYEEMAS